jgi:ABC-type glycerol-3-phosphate transport system substrate-binding protein
VTLEWFAKLKGIAQEQIDAFVGGFTGTRPAVSVNVTAVQLTQDGLTKLATFQASGTAVDVVSTVAGIPELRQLKGAHPLNDLISRDKFDTGQFAKNTYEGVVVGGKTLALPHAYAGNELVLVANKTLFARAGVPLPPPDWNASWTWDQFRDVLKRLTSPTASPPVAGVSRFGTIYDLPPMWGGRWTSADGKTITCDSPAMVDAFTRYYDLVLQDRSATFSPGAGDFGKGEPFLRGQSATFTICCAVPTTTAQLQDIDWAFVPFPKAQRAVPDMGAADVAIWSQSRHPDQAWEFVRYAIDEGRLATLEQRMPSQSRAVGPYVQQNYGHLPGVRPEVFTKTPDFIPPPEPLFQSPASNDAGNMIDTAFGAVASGAKTVPATLAELKPQLQAMLDRYRDG